MNNVECRLHFPFGVEGWGPVVQGQLVIAGFSPNKNTYRATTTLCTIGMVHNAGCRRFSIGGLSAIPCKSGVSVIGRLKVESDIRTEIFFLEIDFRCVGKRTGESIGFIFSV